MNQCYPQEISNMLANNLTLDDEEAVQEEFKELQALAVSFPTNHHNGISFDTRSGSQGWTKGQTPRCSKNKTGPCRDSRYRITLPPRVRDLRFTIHPRTPSGRTSPGTGASPRIGPYAICSRVILSVYLEFCTIRFPSARRRR